MKKHLLFLLILTLFLLSSFRTPEANFQNQLDQAISEEFEYKTFSEQGFSLDYPDWEDVKGEGVELSVTRGYCSVSANIEKMPATQWYSLLLTAIEDQEGELLIATEDNLHIRFKSPYENLSLVSDNRIFECNNNAMVVTITCIEDALDKTKDINNRVFSSVECKGQKAQAIEETEFTEFIDEDFYAEIPDWDTLEDDADHLAGVTKGVCSVIVDKHNALPEDIMDWMERAIEDNRDHELLKATDDEITYTMPYEDQEITAMMNVVYCNYQSYITQVLCVDDLMNDNFENIRDEVMESPRCKKTYTPPTKEVLEEKKKTIIKEEPEEVKEIEDEIVKTNAGEAYSIDEELVVYFINNNAFFTKIMKDFPEANIVITDENTGNKLNFKADIDDNGKITSLDDGKHSNPDVTLKIPLKDALNIFGNAQNLNPLNLLAFAVNVETVPENVKEDVIKKALSGGYN